MIFYQFFKQNQPKPDCSISGQSRMGPLSRNDYGDLKNSMALRHEAFQVHLHEACDCYNSEIAGVFLI